LKETVPAGRPPFTDDQRVSQREQLAARVLEVAIMLWVDALGHGLAAVPVFADVADLLGYTVKGLQSAMQRADLRWDKLRDQAWPLAEERHELLKVAANFCRPRRPTGLGPHARYSQDG
jgi:hypothetical protein